MSKHSAFRRQPVEPQYAQQLQVTTIPAPIRGLILNENESYMQPGGTLVHDNWFPTLTGVKLRGGCKRWNDLHALDATVPPVPDPSRLPVISAFEYTGGTTQKMFAANAQKLFEVTFAAALTLVATHANGNYSASQMANAAGDFLIAVNDAGDFPLRFDGVTWTTLNAGQIHANELLPTAVDSGANLTHVNKYRNRWFFIEANSMNAWYLPLNAIEGQLELIPLSGAASKGGKLLFSATWSIDAGDGIDDKLVFVTSLGELLVFTGGNPADAANWRQEGRYQIGAPLGKNASFSLGGDLHILTVDGITPVSQSISKEAGALELAMITRTIEPLWHTEVTAKRSWPWTVRRWDEYSGIFVTTPGDKPGDRHCLVANSTTFAWCRFTGWDATCWIRLRGDFFFGTQDGLVQQADRTGFDDGSPYVACLVGGWEMFGMPANQVVWHQARAVFKSSAGQPFVPQLSATINYEIVIPLPPPPGPDPGLHDVWDQGLWDVAKWDQAALTVLPVRNTMWVSIGMTGFAHAPILQVQVAQQTLPQVELIAIAATFERAGVNV